jgi:ankyrin repeat protein
MRLMRSCCLAIWLVIAISGLGSEIADRNKLDESLLKATADGAIDPIKMLLSNGANVNAKDKFGWTPLHFATAQGSEELAKFLITAGGNINAKDTAGDTPLHQAADLGKDTLVRLFATNGADVNIKRKDGSTPLHVAAAKGRRISAEVLIAESADVEAKDSEGQTPLNAAVRFGQRDVIELLISKGADINTKNNNGETLLHISAANGDKDAVDLLVRKGVDVNAKDRWGWTPLQRAARNGNTEIVKLLISKGADVQAKDRDGTATLSMAAMAGNTDIAELLIMGGADINTKDRWEWTPLHYACWRDHRDTVEFLLSKGADINSKEEEGKTPIAVAKSEGCNEIVELLRARGATESLHDAVIIEDANDLKRLIASGADVNAMDENGQTPLHVAASRGSKKMVELLIEKGARTEAKNISGQTALYDAVELRKVEIVKLLLALGADSRTIMTSGNTALHAAAAKGYQDIAELLLAHDADINSGESESAPIHEAMKADQKQMVQFLIDKGADIPGILAAAYLGRVNEIKELLASGIDINTKDRAKFSALHCATCGNQTDVAEFLISRGADVNASDKQGQKPLDYALVPGLREMTELLVAKGANVDDQDKVRALLEATYDGFTGKLGLKWDILHPDPSHWSLSKNMGALTITTQDGTWYKKRTDYKNLFLIDYPGTPGTDFQITTRLLNFEPMADYNQAGLICWNGENNSLKFVYEWSSFGGSEGQRVLTVLAETEEAGDVECRNVCFHVDQQPQAIWLRLMKRGNVYTFYTSTNGRTFTKLKSPVVYDVLGLIDNSVHWGDRAVKRVGFFAHNGTQLRVAQIDASFDFFEIRVLPSQ